MRERIICQLKMLPILISPKQCKLLLTKSILIDDHLDKETCLLQKCGKVVSKRKTSLMTWENSNTIFDSLENRGRNCNWRLVKTSMYLCLKMTKGRGLASIVINSHINTEEISDLCA